jgi:hypothetical protein
MLLFLHNRFYQLFGTAGTSRPVAALPFPGALVPNPNA